ncbi:glycine cleavage system aminomethyltransferase GcvT [Agromyces seonyuensis]|uniref:Aminomethyltransferase n=1 Tax=Agromyces seonyuensis TaxID=2662446 RepID=A0A6I4NVL0_9MICO|nr:glycine cleavage system aminomethyltransferase GcvT [Agromyces seonyuensis]
MPGELVSQRVSPLEPVHRALGASFTDFGGWEMPVRYGSDLAEHQAVRERAGIFDISHMAEFAVGGLDAGAFLDYALAGKVSTLPLSKAKYSMILAADGGILDDLIVYKNHPAEFLVVANAGNRDVVAAALAERAAGFDVHVTDRTDEIALIAVQGPRALEILESTEGLHADELLAMGHTLESLPYYACMGMLYEGAAILVARTGYTGEDGFELYVDRRDAVNLWNALTAAGEAFGLAPAGLAARDTLRLEAGMPLYGHELGTGILPVQAGLGRIVPLATKGDFVGRAGIEAGPAEGARVLVGLAAEGRRAARAGYAVFAEGAAADAEPVGEVTSGALSPTLGHPIAMAFVAPESAEPGTALELDVRGTRIPAHVVALPFYSRAK